MLKFEDRSLCFKFMLKDQADQGSCKTQKERVLLHSAPHSLITRVDN